jgi:transcriptional regulator with XRE-family HTH domain
MEEIKIENVIRKITSMRKNKGFSLEYMAYKLSICSAAYRKIETGETKLTLERLNQISQILGVSLPELLEIENDVIQQTNNGNATGSQHKIEKVN